MSFKETAKQILKENGGDPNKRGTYEIAGKTYTYDELEKDVEDTLKRLIELNSYDYPGDGRDVIEDKHWDILAQKWKALATEDLETYDWNRYLTHDRFDDRY